MMKNILIVLFGASLFGLIALARGVSLGQEVESFYLVSLVILSFVFGICLFFIQKIKSTTGDDNE